jgi:hypothetical protein
VVVLLAAEILDAEEQGLPSSEDRTRRAVDLAFADDPQPSDGVDTA